MKFSNTGITLELAKKLLRTDKSGKYYFELPQVKTPEELKKLVAFFFGSKQSELMFRSDFEIGPEILNKKTKLIRKLDIITGVSEETKLDIGYFHLDLIMFKLLETSQKRIINGKSTFKEVFSVDHYMEIINPEKDYFSNYNYLNGNNLYIKNRNFIKDCLKIRNINYTKFYMAFINGTFKKDFVKKQHRYKVNGEHINLFDTSHKKFYFSKYTNKYYDLNAFSNDSLYTKAMNNEEKEFFSNFDKLIKTKSTFVNNSFKEELKKLKNLNGNV